ncbi:type VI secretion protein, partial [Streptomyces sp. DSM 41921]|nr:type VI secretion protein [Streptomyces sp. DSM 41921]
MRPDDRRTPRDTQGGIPDGLLVGILAFLLGMTLMVWTATGLAGLFAHGSWPSGVTFVRTPLAMRHLVAQPHDIPGAWPGTPPGDLSGYGLFWGLLIGQLMILVVLTVFVMGTLARWRAVRTRHRLEQATPPGPRQHATPAQGPVQHDAPATPQHPTPGPVEHDAPATAQHPGQGPVQHDIPTPAQSASPQPHTSQNPAPAPHDVPTPRRAAAPEPTHLLEPTAPLAPTPAVMPAAPASPFGQE